MKIEGDLILFESTGRQVRSARGVIGLSSDGEAALDRSEPPISLYLDETIEMAEYMILAWAEFYAGIKA